MHPTMTSETSERTTIRVPPPPAPSESARMANRLQQLAADVRNGTVPAWQVETLLALFGR